MSGHATTVEGVERAFSQAGWAAQHAVAELQAQYSAAHVLMRPRLFIDGNMWCALYGENLQDGVAGFGDSPSAACGDFDAQWVKALPSAQGGAK